MTTTYKHGLAFCEPCGAIEARTEDAITSHPALPCICGDPPPERELLKHEPAGAIYCAVCQKRFVPGERTEVVISDTVKIETVKCPHGGCGQPNDPEKSHLVYNVVHPCRCGGNYAIAAQPGKRPAVHHKNPPCKMFNAHRGGDRYFDWVKTGKVDGARPMSRRERRQQARRVRRG